MTEWAHRADVDLAMLLRALSSVAEMVARCHDRGVVHGDLKPDNILVGETGSFSLIDFGSAYTRGSGLTEVPAEGTRLFAAPEVWEGRANDPAADVYAFAATAFYLLTGTVPPTIMPRDHKLVDALVNIKGVPEEVADFLARGLAINPADRPTPAAAQKALVAGASEAEALAEAYCVSYIGRTEELEKGAELRIGRSLDSDVHIANDAAVSRYACSIRHDEDGLSISHTGRLHGIQVNTTAGRSALLGPGDILFLAQANHVDIVVEGLQRHSIAVRRGSGRFAGGWRPERAAGQPSTLHATDTRSEARPFTLSQSQQLLVTAYAEPILLGTSTASATHAEVAERLGRSVYTVRNRLTEIIYRYREHLPGSGRQQIDRDTFCRRMIESGKISLRDLELLPKR